MLFAFARHSLAEIKLDIMKVFLGLVGICVSGIISAQSLCSVAKINSVAHTQAVPNAHVVLMNKYDAKFHHLNINVERTGKSISGNIRTLAQVKSLTLDTFGVEFYNTMIIDSARINGALVSPVRMQDAVNFILPSSLSQNDMIDATIYYHGNAPTVNGSAIGDLNKDGRLIICLVDADWDYSGYGANLDGGVSPPFSANEKNGGYFSENTGTSKDPKIDYVLSTPYGNNVNGVASANIGKVNGRSTFIIEKVIGA